MIVRSDGEPDRPTDRSNVRGGLELIHHSRSFLNRQSVEEYANEENSWRTFADERFGSGVFGGDCVWTG